MKIKDQYKLEELLDAGDWIEYTTDSEKGYKIYIESINDIRFEKTNTEQSIATMLVNRLYKTRFDKTAKLDYNDTDER
jgi:hypothetical protein